MLSVLHADHLSCEALKQVQDDFSFIIGVYYKFSPIFHFKPFSVDQTGCAMKINDELNTIVVKEFLEFNHFQNKRNNDCFNTSLGLIFKDLHDENILSSNGVLFFIDTIFYLTPDFYTL